MNVIFLIIQATQRGVGSSNEDSAELIRLKDCLDLDVVNYEGLQSGSHGFTRVAGLCP